MKNIVLCIPTAVLLLSNVLFGQLSEQDVRQRLDLIHSGKIEQVRMEVFSLLKQFPNDPGVKYLDAYVTENGDHAVKKYQSFVDNYPQSVWADDALYKVYQYYYAVGLYKTADAKLAQLNEQYPGSIYAKSSGKETVQSENQPAPKPEIQTPVQQPVNDEKKESEAPANTAAVGSFTVQVGVYSQESKAAEQAVTITSVVGKQAVVFAKQSGGRTVYAVLFEGFQDEQSARNFGGVLKSKYNLDWFVVKR